MKSMLSIPDEALLETVDVVRAGLQTLSVQDDTRRSLLQWCGEAEQYLDGADPEVCRRAVPKPPLRWVLVDSEDPVEPDLFRVLRVASAARCWAVHRPCPGLSFR